MATDIMEVRHRNMENKNFKEQMRKQKEDEEQERLRKNFEQRLATKEQINYNKDINARKNKEEAERLKIERLQHEEMIAMQKKSEELKA